MKNVNWNKWRNLTGLGALGFLILFQHQNCAPAPGGSTLASGEVSSPVQVIDRVDGSSALRFTYQKVELQQSVQKVTLQGECERIVDGATVGWDVNDGSGALTTGEVSCSQGQFQVVIAPTQELECDKTYEVRARLVDGTEGRALLERRCAN